MIEISKDEIIEKIANSGAQPFSYEGSNFKFHAAYFEVDLDFASLFEADKALRSVPNQAPEALEEQLLVRNPRGATFILPKLSGLLRETIGDRNTALVAESQRTMQQAYEFLTGEHEPANYFGVQIGDEGQIDTAVMSYAHLFRTATGRFGHHSWPHGIYEIGTNNEEMKGHEVTLYAGLGQIAWRVANPQPATP